VRSNNDRIIDYTVILLYLGAVLLFSFYYKKKGQTVKEYFLGAEDVPWWAVTFSIIAAETSTLTFISIPGLAYITNLNFLQVTFGYAIGRVIVAKYFLPAYFKGELTTAYSFLENRFGVKTRTIASVVFLFTRTAADGVRLFATAIPLKLLLGIEYPYAILIIALVSLVYSWVGGVKGIIWVDVLQMGVYLLGAVISIIIIFSNIAIPFSTLFSQGKLQIINLNFGSGIGGFFSQPYTLVSAILGGIFLSMSTHGADQLIVQKLLATKNLKTAQKALSASGIIIIFQFFLFLLLGAGLYLFYGKLNIKSDEIFPKFIIENLPAGISGFVIAGLLAAALSTLAASISSMSSSALFDLFAKKVDNFKNHSLIIAVLSLVWTSILVVSSFFFMNTSKAVVEIALSISSFTFGGLLGIFLLGMLYKKADEKAAIMAFCFATICISFVIVYSLTAWTWFILIGVIITLVSGILFTRLFSRIHNG
jgi:solute:Na+ symporter, SSS family